METPLIRKYNVPGPRYTSYPTVPAWKQEEFSVEEWKKKVKNTFDLTNTADGISLYIHLPYCESLCTYCGCTTRITVNHAVEKPYIDSILLEWKMYLRLFEETPEITEIHLGGGTPTFFSPENLAYLIEGIKSTSIIKSAAEFGLEGHPNNTTSEHMQVLYDLGFRRISFGIQDFDPKVQTIVNRIQTFETVKTVVDHARRIGYTSINFDLIYGLPLQTQESIIDTFEKVSLLKPDRIAYYSYAHVPWVKPGQRMFTEADLPANEEKRQLYELGKEILAKMNYKEIGMDHFALKDDDLYQAAIAGRMHRNFMGYTTNHSLMSLGLGVSAIGDSWTAYGQNIKTVEAYRAKLEKDEFPIFKTHFLSADEEFIRKHITQLMCKFQTTWELSHPLSNLMTQGMLRLNEMVEDGLVELSDNEVKILEAGRPFARNVCMAFDIHLWNESSKEQVFSMTI
jgi:oxygen-independent coproporphyrinogen-3 oxidase